MTNLQWTQGVPEQSGWYWASGVYLGDIEAVWVAYSESYGKWMVMVTGSELELQPNELLDTLFCGPLLPPEPPETTAPPQQPRCLSGALRGPDSD